MPTSYPLITWLISVVIPTCSTATGPAALRQCETPLEPGHAAGARGALQLEEAGLGPGTNAMVGVEQRGLLGSLMVTSNGY